MSISKIRCLVPFTQMFFMPKGFVSTCCPPWTKLGPIGNVFIDKDPIAIWNGKRIRAIRAALIANQLEKICSPRKCPVMASGEIIDLNSFGAGDSLIQAVIEQVRSGKTELETGPISLNMSNSGSCNLACKMCGAHSRFVPHDQNLSDILFNKVLPQFLPTASEITLTGNGDPFFRKDSREFMFRKSNPADYPHLKIQLITNGLLLNKTMWEKVSHNRFGWIRVSVDGSTKKTYEKIRLHGSWEKLQENLAFISSLRQEGKFNNFGLHCVVMKSNYKELAEVARMGLNFGCDQVHFIRISGGVVLEENINFSKDVEAISFIGRLLNDPVFKDPRVHSYEISDYRRYQNAIPSFWDRIRAALICKVLSFPVRWFYLLRFKLPLDNPLILRLLRSLGRV